MKEYGPSKKTEVYVHADKRESIVPLNCPLELVVAALFLLAQLLQRMLSTLFAQWHLIAEAA